MIQIGNGIPHQILKIILSKPKVNGFGYAKSHCSNPRTTIKIIRLNGTLTIHDHQFRMLFQNAISSLHELFNDLPYMLNTISFQTVLGDNTTSIHVNRHQYVVFVQNYWN
ncbi:uncharacterized protein LOC112685296 isoform X1 [Sipha flava]|uniref:Uncharacterized protein LOC112685296 isoform X1 n=1 Tax=Sipha flava TaxID=143950 RepID=A0A8B8FPQ3_9HEMI|nr:uncharacterized protein LOC112685296 isoform X1 [Sipha flava]